jgi:probable nicotinate-nucleotide adenylyltransferase
MAELATAAYEKFEVSDFEAQRSGLSYTSDTLALLRKEYPDNAFSLILGADSFFEFENWHAPEDICRNARLLVAAREYAREHSSLSEHASHLEERFGARVALIPAPLLDISSMHIRELLAAGKKSAAQYLPAAVYRYIQDEGLYVPEKEGKL